MMTMIILLKRMCCPLAPFSVALLLSGVWGRGVSATGEKFGLPQLPLFHSLCGFVPLSESLKRAALSTGFHYRSEGRP